MRIYVRKMLQEVTHTLLLYYAIFKLPTISNKALIAEDDATEENFFSCPKKYA